MPTGYTAAIADGITFKQYALDCARAFGATITMRDESRDAEILQEFEPSTWSKEQLAEYKGKLKDFLAMDEKSIEEKFKQSLDKSILYHQEQIKKNNDLRIKYEAMLKQVSDYKEPSADHVKFKEFMISQIKESIQFDCSGTYRHDEIKKLQSVTCDDWKQAELEKINLAIGYHEKQNAKEIERTNQRNQWIKQLCESL